MGCCALGTCEDLACDLCQRVARLPPPARLRDHAARYAEPAAVPIRPSRDPSKIRRTRRAITGSTSIVALQRMTQKRPM